MWRIASAIVAVVVLVSGMARAADAPATQPAGDGVAAASPAATAIDPALEKDIRKLLDMTGASKIGMQVMDGMIESFRKSTPGVPASFWDEFRKEVDPNVLLDMTVGIYARHFTPEDVKALIAFYESPVGKKFVRSQPELVREGMEAGQRWGQDVARRANQKLAERRGQTTQPSK